MRAILFSDILTIPHAMNLGLELRDRAGGPKFERPVRSAADIDKLGVPDPNVELKYVIDAVALVRRELDGRIPLIGFAGSPWTVATYMVEGGGSKELRHHQAHDVRKPRELHRLLEVLARATILYLNAQIAAGAQAVMLFDTWGGVLTPAQYAEFSLRYMARDRRLAHPGSRGPPRAEHRVHQGRRRMACDDRRDRLRRGRRRLDHGPRGSARAPCEDRVALQGNLDPSALFAPARDAARRDTCACSRASAQAPGTCSIWVTGSRPTSIPSGWRGWSRRCAITRSEAPGV